MPPQPLQVSFRVAIWGQPRTWTLKWFALIFDVSILGYFWYEAQKKQDVKNCKKLWANPLTIEPRTGRTRSLKTSNPYGPPPSPPRPRNLFQLLEFGADNKFKFVDRPKYNCFYGQMIITLNLSKDSRKLRHTNIFQLEWIPTSTFDKGPPESCFPNFFGASFLCVKRQAAPSTNLPSKLETWTSSRHNRQTETLPFRKLAN